MTKVDRMSTVVLVYGANVNTCFATFNM